jgi:hypothetical protein
MSTNDTINVSPNTEITSENADVPEQLSLLAGSVPLQFRLDERTRRAGLQHIAELRSQMAAQAAARKLATGRGTGTHRKIAA